jgi:mono/diheme cytochrome c family protein
MIRLSIAVFLLGLAVACARPPVVPEEKPRAFGAALISISGEKQAAGVGALLEQPLVIQANDAQGAPVPGAMVRFIGAAGMTFMPERGLTGPDGQITTNVMLGGIPGHYQISVVSLNSTGKPAEIRVDEVALGYQAMLGEKINQIHCVRCHNSESTPERVSNHDNLDAMPHAFTEGAVLSPMSEANLVAIIARGGVALNKSAAMPPYGNTLTKVEIDALVAYLRAVADPPFRPQGVFNASN